MASKRAQRRKVCGDKDAYSSAAAAEGSIKHAQRNGHWVRAYTCPHCHQWHIGHPPRSVRQSLAAKARNRRLA
jgi:hypothetical protein